MKTEQERATNTTYVKNQIRYFGFLQIRTHRVPTRPRDSLKLNVSSGLSCDLLGMLYAVKIDMITVCCPETPTLRILAAMSM